MGPHADKKLSPVPPTKVRDCNPTGKMNRISAQRLLGEARGPHRQGPRRPQSSARARSRGFALAQVSPRQPGAQT